MIFAEVIGMKHGILTAAFLMASAGFASADYVIIVANVGGQEQKTLAGTGMQGMQGMQGMMGGAGMQGGGPPMGGAGMMGRGSPPSGGAGMGGGPPMGGAGMMGRGSPPSGGAGMGGGPPMGGAGMGGAGMRGMMGMAGGGGAGMRGMMGMAGGGGGAGMMGMQGMRGGMMMGMQGMRGGMMMGMQGMMGMMDVGSTDADDVPEYIIAVVEVKPKQLGSLTKNLEKHGYASVELPARLGKSCQLLKKPSFGELFVITEDKDKPVPTVSARFRERFERLVKEKPSISELLDHAEWTLQHGLVDKFPSVMDELVKIDKSNPAAVAYLKVKADLERPTRNEPWVATLRRSLLDRFKMTETPHYLLVHNAAHETAVEVKTHSEHLENSFRGYYYWFALKGIALPVPQNRLGVVLTSNESVFEQLHKILTPGPVVVDGFFARREGLTVMHSQRQDDMYQALSKYWENWKGKGFQRTELLAGNGKWSGAPPSIKAEQTQGWVKTMEAQMLALMLKALEQEAELATVSHEASRQLLFASGLLPRNVAVPEWILFGMGSFFETPLQSPWPTIGAPNPYYLPRWRELKSKDPNKGGLEKTSLETLRKVVTDGYFRNLPPDGKGESEEHLLHEHALRKGRTVAWSLTYFLAQQKLDGLRRYFAELSKLPRDIELDDTVLLDCFARAFGCMDTNNKVNDAELKKLANEWYGYWQTVHFESESIMRDIRKKIAEKVKESQENAQKENQGNSGQQPGASLLPGMNPGGAPSGKPVATPPGLGQPQRGPQQGRPQQGGAAPPGGPTPPAQPAQPAPPARRRGGSS